MIQYIIGIFVKCSCTINLDELHRHSLTMLINGIYISTRSSRTSVFYSLTNFIIKCTSIHNDSLVMQLRKLLEYRFYARSILVSSVSQNWSFLLDHRKRFGSFSLVILGFDLNISTPCE